MTATGVDTQATRASDDAGPAVLAPWAARAGALALDIVPGVAMLATAVLVALSVPLHSTWWWVCVSTGAVAILFTAFNRLLLPVIGGQTSGGLFSASRSCAETATPSGRGGCCCET